MPKLYKSNKDETVRMFKSNSLEVFSKINWYVPLIIYLPIIIFLMYKGAVISNFSEIELLALFISGIFIWTFIEYSLHRFVFHYKVKSNFGKRLHFIFHGVHHDYPNDSKRLVMPPSISLPLAITFWFLFSQLIKNSSIFPFYSGFLFGYLCYDITHYAIHHFNMKNKIALAIKNHHMIHHYKHDNLGYGVSQPLWDHIFKTTYPKIKSD